MKKRCYTALAVCGLAAICFIGCGKAQQGKEAENNVQGAKAEAETEEPFLEEGPSLGEAADQPVGISFEGQDIAGNSVTESILSESELTMVNVWATYCGPCLREMPALGELAGEYDAGEFQIIGIISDVQEGADEETVGYAAGLIGQTGADYTHLLLNQSVYDAFLTKVSVVPTTYFVDENGVILDTVMGAMEKSAWEEKINGLLGK